MSCKVLQVKQCGPIEIEGLQEILDGLSEINTTLQGEVVVAPSDEWAALLESSVTSALESAEIEVTVGNTVSVIVDTSAGPVEVTGTVTVAEPLNVAVTNFPTEFAISNLADLEGLELTVTLDGETVTVTPDQGFTDLFTSLIDTVESTVRVDWEPTGNCVFDADGNKVTPHVKQFEEKRYAHNGMFLGSEIVLSVYNEDGTVAGYTLAAGEVVRPCETGNSVLTEIRDLLAAVIGDPSDECPCENEVTEGFRIPATEDFENTKFNLDDPTFTNAYGDVGVANWTANDLATALNATAANATPPVVPSGIDYSTTVWAVGTDATGDYLFVSSGPVPTSLDLVSLPLSIPLATL